MKKTKKLLSLIIITFMLCGFFTGYTPGKIIFSSHTAAFHDAETTPRRPGKFPETKKIGSGENFLQNFKGIRQKNANNTTELTSTPVNTNTDEEKIYVYPGGELIGIRLGTKGVIAVDHEDLSAGADTVPSPAKKAGILSGDIITHIGGQEVNSADEFEKILSLNDGQKCIITLQREEVTLKKEVYPVRCTDNTVRIGLWVRDNITGLGTMSFITEDKRTFAALGHPVSDSDTGITVPVRKGELAGAEVMSIVRGKINSPGEIRGIIKRSGDISGEVMTNNEFGIYGKLNMTSFALNTKPIAVASQNEISEGSACIITTVDNEKRVYSIEIEKVSSQSVPSGRSMVIKITDEELLAKTGGIIQGMSGSPVIQNGMLAGVVTHVLTGDPARGYAVFAEWMIEKCSSCQNMTAFCVILY